MIDYSSIAEKEIEKISKSQSILAVILVGSAAFSDNLCSAKDIDIFVILSDGETLEREVKERERVIFDITYLPIALLKQGIKEKWPFLIHGLWRNRPIVIKDTQINSLLDDIYALYLQGPGMLAEEEVKYIRFKLNQAYEDLLIRKDDSLNFRFLAHNLFKEVLTNYFRLNNQWVPRDKKMLDEVKIKNQDLHIICAYFLEEENADKNLSYLENMIKYVLNPFGGKQKYWSKGEFPLK